MNTPMRFSVVGGDVRQANLAALIAADGHIVSTFGIDARPLGPPVEAAGTLASCLENTDCVVLPIPVIRDAGTINAPALRKPHTVEELLTCAHPGQILVGGRMPQEMRERGRREGMYILDFLDREDFAVRNAVPTAEGALQIALENTNITLHGSQCLVVGFGRIGKVLAGNLKDLGAHVTVSARKQEDFAWMEVAGYDKAETDQLEGLLDRFDVIFNTAPAMVLPEARLRELQPHCLCIDLASTPGGIDFDAAHDLGLNCIWALGLPGKVAPRTAGVILRDTIYHIMSERRSSI